MRAQEHERTTADTHSGASGDHHDWLRDQMRFGLGSIPHVTAAVGATGHAQTASEQAHDAAAQLTAIQR